MTKEVYSNCYVCGDELVEGQEIITVHQYYYCNTDCLEQDLKRITLGTNKDDYQTSYKNEFIRRGGLHMIKKHEVVEMLKGDLSDWHWENLIGVDIEDINSSEFYVTFSELQDIESNPICKNKYKITIELCNE